MKKLLTTIALLAVFAIAAQAQMVGSTANYDRSQQQSQGNSSSFGGFAIYVGGAFPLGDFKAGTLKDKRPQDWALWYDDGRKGYAGMGFNIGWDVLIPVSKSGLGIFIGMDYFRNGYNKELKKFISDNDDYIEKSPKVSNFSPLMLGLRYLGTINNNFGIFGEVGVGPNVRFISKAVIEEKESGYDYYYYEYEYSATMKYNTAVTFAFKIGAGVMIAKHLSVALDYYSLGSAQVKGTVDWREYEYYDGYEYRDSGTSKFKGKDLKCSEFVLRVGYKF